MFPVEYWSAPIDIPGGRGAAVAFTDLSERRQAEGVLRERDAILSALGQPVYVAASEGAITYANPAGVTALGFSDAHELIGQDGHRLIHYKRPDGSPFPIEDCPIAQCRTTGKPVRAEEDWWVRKDGSMMPVTYTAVPFEAPGGYGIAVSFADLTARRRPVGACQADHADQLKLLGRRPAFGPWLCDRAAVQVLPSLWA